MTLEFRLMVGYDVYRSYGAVRDSALAAQDAGFTAIFRGDHLLSVDGEHDHSVTEAWTCLAGLARDTTTIRFGTLVSPATFRHPAVLARTVATVDEMSNGRVEVGLGAGWYEPEHETLGIALPPWPERFDHLEEQLAIVRGLFTKESFSFDGEHYHLAGAQLGRGFIQRPNPPIVVGGNGKPRTLRLAATFADELNLDQVLDPDDIVTAYAGLAAALEVVGRPSSAVIRSNVIGWPGLDVEANQARFAAYEAAGVQRLYVKRPADLDLSALAAFSRHFIAAG